MGNDVTYKEDWDPLNRKKDVTYRAISLYKNIPGIYKITNTTNGMFYIGSSNRVRNRLLGHLWKLRQGKHKIPSLQKDFSENGKELFTFEVLEIVPKESLLKKEAVWFARHERILSYNIADITPRSFVKISPNTTVVCPVIFEEQVKKFIKSLKADFCKEGEVK
jgi:group I intron endonuclease